MFVVSLQAICTLFEKRSHNHTHTYIETKLANEIEFTRFVHKFKLHIHERTFKVLKLERLNCVYKIGKKGGDFHWFNSRFRRQFS